MSQVSTTGASLTPEARLLLYVGVYEKGEDAMPEMPAITPAVVKGQAPTKKPPSTAGGVQPAAKP